MGKNCHEELGDGLLLLKESIAPVTRFEVGFCGLDNLLALVFFDSLVNHPTLTHLGLTGNHLGEDIADLLGNFF